MRGDGEVRIEGMIGQMRTRNVEGFTHERIHVVLRILVVSVSISLGRDNLFLAAVHIKHSEAYSALTLTVLSPVAGVA